MNPSWLIWRSWSQAVGLGEASDLSQPRFNHYTDTIQAALNSEGIVLGWATLVSDLIENGRLVRVGAHRLVTEDRYHILTPAGRDPSAATVTLLNWLAAAFETSQRRLFNACQD